MRTPEGLPPMGLRPDADNPGRATVNYFAPAAERVVIEFLESGTQIDLTPGPYGHWTGEFDEPSAGTTYGFRVSGPWEPQYGLRLNPAKLLLDPYALAMTGELIVNDAIHSYQMQDPDLIDDADSAPFVPHSVYVPPLEPTPNRPPRIPWDRTIIYETHVKGFTKLHPEVPEELRGTYAGLAQQPVIDYLVEPRRHQHRAAPGPALRARTDAARARAHELLGLQPRRLLRPALHLRGAWSARGADRGVPGHGRRAARRRPRGHHRRGLQPHRRGRPPRSDPGVEGLRECGHVLDARRGHVRQPHRVRQRDQRRVPPHGRVDPLVAAVLGHRSARGRFPLRPRLDTGPHLGDGHHLGAGPVRDGCGPGALAGQTDR
jgi:hypothetical protein